MKVREERNFKRAGGWVLEPKSQVNIFVMVAMGIAFALFGVFHEPGEQYVFLVEDVLIGGRGKEGYVQCKSKSEVSV